MVARSVSPTVRVPLARVVNGVPQLAPFFIPDLPAGQIVQYSTLKDNQVRTFDASAETISAVLGLRMDLPGRWEGEFFFNYGRNEQCDSCVTGSINLAALTEQVFAGNVNPLSSVPLTAEQARSVYGDTRFQSRTTLEQAAVREVQEETGYGRVRVVAPLGDPLRSEFMRKGRWTVRDEFYYLMELEDETPAALDLYDDHERDRQTFQLLWVPLVGAAERLTYEPARTFMRRAADWLQGRPHPHGTA